MADPNVSSNLNALPLPPRYPGIARALAHLAARRAVKRQLQAQGVRPFQRAEALRRRAAGETLVEIT
jgi:hypothetical protein